MTNKENKIIVIGSGVGGLASAAALSKYGHKVLVLEQHSVAGGLTHTFSRNHYTWDIGVHYLGQMGPGDRGKNILDWLTGGKIEMASIGSAYDTIHFPNNFNIAFSSPVEALKKVLVEKFPQSAAQLSRYFQLLDEIDKLKSVLFKLRVIPAPISTVLAWFNKKKLQKWFGRTTDEVLREYISDEKLRAVLASQSGDYGGMPHEGSFGMLAILFRHYADGAYYPVGGSKVFANALIPVIENAGGEVRVSTPVKSIIVEGGKAVGARTEDGTEHFAKYIVTDIGVQNTLFNLLPKSFSESAWGKEVLSLNPSFAHVGMYLGFEGDIQAIGASACNHWFYNTWDINEALWDNLVEEQPPLLFISFPSLKDPSHNPGPKQLHTAEILASVKWDEFDQWANTQHGKRPKEYETLKSKIQQILLEQFGHYFPALVPMIKYTEISTPVTTQHYTRRYHGAIYGLETTPRRFFSKNLNVKTPVPGLYLSGQDVVSPGIMGAIMGGMFAAAAIDRRVISHIPK
jgi:all-trans-retinol 13,14-reductase